MVRNFFPLKKNNNQIQFPNFSSITHVKMLFRFNFTPKVVAIPALD